MTEEDDNAQVASETDAERFVLIRTDKAVNPSQLMGATKRAAEMVIKALAAAHPATNLMAVRFGKELVGQQRSMIPKIK